jgi:eukaryotic-like serine/threonine-protein kinase
MSAPPANRRIPYFGDFVLFEELGRGGMGVVYNAQQTKLDRPVALKVLHAGCAIGTAALQRLRIEAEAVAKLDHPNIVPIYEFGEHEGHPYLAMQLIEGESLSERIARNGIAESERDAANLVARVARATHHAHLRGVLHRDLKPGNVLLDETGEPHLIDFGLAKCLEQDSGLTQTGLFMGTPAFTSPEQAAGLNKAITTATDIYSLGAILFALLTGRPPFVGEGTATVVEQVKHNSPPPPRSIRPALSRDLEVICLKCLEKSPASRYQSALALAEDLERWLASKPILARPAGTLKRLALWTKRHPVHAALGATAGLLILLAGLAALFVRETRVKEVEARHHIQRQQLLDDVQRIRLTERAPGWFDQAWAKAVQAAKIPTAVKSPEVINQAAALLAGLEARREQQFTNFGATSARFDPAGNRLLVGGLGDGAKLWDAAQARLQTAFGTNWGPTAFLPDGTPTQLHYDPEHHSLKLVGCENSTTYTEWKLPTVIQSLSLPKSPPAGITLAPDGSVCVAVLPGNETNHAVVVFAAGTEHQVLEPAAFVTAVALSSDGSLVAIADKSGTVGLWRIHDGKLLTRFNASCHEIHSLALHRTARGPESDRADLGNLLLAAGDAGGTVSLWDVATQTVTAYCRGGHYQVFALAFSPDGMTLASGGRGPVKLWDWSTGRELLSLPVGGSGEFISGLDFTSNGTRLAISSYAGNHHPNHVTIWELEYGRGINTLRGLSGQIAKLCFAENAPIVAALSHNWEVGVWSLEPSRLLCVFAAPKGNFADNCAVALSPDGTRLAVAGQHAAMLWDVPTGRLLARWELPPGLANTMGFADPEQLLLFRVETRDAQRLPASNAPFQDHPRVCRIRDLLRSDPLLPVGEYDSFNAHIFNASAAPNARRFLIEGISTRSGTNEIRFACLDGSSGRELWNVPSARRQQSAVLAVDPTSRLAAFQPGQSPEVLVANLESGTATRRLNFHPAALLRSPQRYATLGYPDGNGRGITVLGDPNRGPQFTLGVDGITIGPVMFNPIGTHLGWGNADGTITVCDLNEVQNRLAQAGLTKPD